MKMNLNSLNEILKKGWPNENKIEQIPFGLKFKELGESKEHGGHVKNVVESMNKLLSRSPVTALIDYDKPENEEYVAVFLSAWQTIKGKNGIFSKSSMGKEKVEKFLRVAALYHDLGKIIRKDRHSLEGYHYIAHVAQEEGTKMKKDEMLGEEGFKLLCDVIHYHDLFGVLGTGEASAAIMIDTLPFRSSTVSEQQTLLSMLMLLNIADISGVIPLTSLKASTLASDWKRLCCLIEDSKGDRQEFARRLIASEQNPEATIGRIRRLLLERPPDNLRSELSSTREIEEVLRVTLGTQFYEFWSDFALVCKLDYALRFILELQKYASENSLSAHHLMEVVVSLIRRLVQSYSALTRRTDGTRRRIGIEVSGWTRTPEISESLIELLYSDLPKGLGWASEEATAWYLE